MSSNEPLEGSKDSAEADSNEVDLEVEKIRQEMLRRLDEPGGSALGADDQERADTPLWALIEAMGRPHHAEAAGPQETTAAAHPESDAGAKATNVPRSNNAGIILGTEESSRQEVGLTAKDRKQGLYLVGLTGTGKTNLILNVALQDMANGDGLCVLDPHGDLTREILERVPPKREDDVILFDPADEERPFGLNFFECANIQSAKEQDRVCSEVMGTFWKLFTEFWGPRMADVLRNTALTFIANQGYTLAEVPRFLTDDGYRAPFLTKVTNPQVLWYWNEFFQTRTRHDQAEIIESSLNKVGRFLSNTLVRNIVGQRASSIDMRRIMDEGKILLVNLAKGQLGEDNSSLLGSILVGKILIAALSRADVPEKERRSFHLIVDEYQSFATSSFPTLQSEARKYSIDTLVAHQYRDQLDELNQGSTLNVGSKVVLRVNGKDASILAAEFDNTPPPPLVVGERQVLGLSHSPWSELEKKSHKNPRVAELVKELSLMLVKQYYQTSYPTSDGTVVERYPLYTFSREETIPQCIKYLDDYLAQRMRGVPASNLSSSRDALIIIGPFTSLSMTQYHYKDPVYDVAPFLSMSSLDEIREGLKKVHAGRHYDYPDAGLENEFQFTIRKKFFIDMVEELGTLLEKEPILASTGQTEPIFATPRLYTDVEAETANKLTNLPNFEARCKLVQGGQLKEFSIKTVGLPGRGDREQADRIRQRSRQTYGRDKKEVEDDIMRRGGLGKSYGGQGTTDYEKA